MHQNRKKLDETLLWFKIFGPLPPETKIRCKDRRYSKGYVEGYIDSYYVYDGSETVDQTEIPTCSPNSFSYALRGNPNGPSWPFAWKKPFTIIKVLKGHRR